MPLPPAVQYARTADDISLAYVVGGSGTTITFLPFHVAHVVHRWSLPDVPIWTSRLAEHFRVVTYDSRGQGLSTRGLVGPRSLTDYRIDLETVLAAADVQHSVLVAYGGFAHVALQYAALNPDAVDGLVLICTSETFAAWPLAAMLAMATEKWDLFVDLMGGGVPDALKRGWRSFVHACGEQAEYIRMVEAFASSDVSELLPHVEVPTLILHSLNQHWLDVDEGTKFASKVKNSQLSYLDGDVEPNADQGTRLIVSFVEGLKLRPPQPTETHEWQDLHARLTARQFQVYALLVVGKTNREIGENLVLSERTVERHISDIYSRLGVRNRAGAVSLAPRTVDTPAGKPPVHAG